MDRGVGGLNPVCSVQVRLAWALPGSVSQVVGQDLGAVWDLGHSHRGEVSVSRNNHNLASAAVSEPNQGLGLYSVLIEAVLPVGNSYIVNCNFIKQFHQNLHTFSKMTNLR